MFGLLSRQKANFVPSENGAAPRHEPEPAADDEKQAVKLTEIGHSDDLPLFTRKLYDVIQMAPSTRHMVCPIEVSQGTDGKPRFAIICQKQEVRSDIAIEVARQLTFKGFLKAEPFVHVATQSVMVELARDAINEVKKSATKSNVSFIGKNTNSALWKMFETIVTFAIENDASDIHFEVERASKTSQIRFRVDGRLAAPREFNLDTHDVLDTIAYLFNIHGKSGSENTYNENKPQQCQIQATIAKRKLLFRWASNQTAKGTKVVLRMLYQDEVSSIRALSELGYLPGQIAIWERVILSLGGGIVLSGVVGSGKSTTMQTVMSMLPDWMSRYTVEDPVEYIMPGTAQFSVSRTLSDHESDPFVAVKRQLKRMDPDAVLIGEIRDRESAGLFRDIAESGHRAFATIHAPSAIDMITLRMVSDEIGIPRGVVATPGFLKLLVYQALVPKLCPHCCKPASEVHTTEYLSRIKRLFDIDSEVIFAKNVAGCPECRRESLPEMNGARGRLVVAEMIELNAVMLHLFREAKNSELKEYISGTRTARFDDSDTTGKSALEVAMYHVANGVFDPKDVESKFGSFEQYENERAR